MNLIIPTAMSLCLAIIKGLLKNIQMIPNREQVNVSLFDIINISGGSFISQSSNCDFLFRHPTTTHNYILIS